VTLCVLLVSACGQEDQVLAPVDPPTTVSLSELFGNQLLRADGSTVGIDAIQNKAIIAIYFGAGWCSHCADFTPILVSAYDSIQAAGKSFEVVHVSFDDSSADMLAYMIDSAMPWLAAPHGGSAAGALVQRYGVQGIPMLVVIDGDANTLTLNGRGDIVTNGAAAYDGWLALSGG